MDALAMLQQARAQAAQQDAQRQQQMAQMAAMAGPMLKGLGQPEQLPANVPGQTMSPIPGATGLPQGMTPQQAQPIPQAQPPQMSQIIPRQLPQGGLQASPAPGMGTNAGFGGLTAQQLAMLQGVNNGPLGGWR